MTEKSNSKTSNHKLKELQATITSQNSQITTLFAELKSSREELLNIKKEKDDSKITITELQTMLSQRNSELSTALAELKTSKEEIAALKKKAADTKLEHNWVLEELQKVIKEKDRQILANPVNTRRERSNNKI